MVTRSVPTCARVREFYERGARYMSLAHNGHNQLSDSHTGEATHDAPNNGISPFGRAVIADMNRLGMIVDVSHASRAAMMQAVALSKAPIDRVALRRARARRPQPQPGRRAAAGDEAERRRRAHRRLRGLCEVRHAQRPSAASECNRRPRVGAVPGRSSGAASAVGAGATWREGVRRSHRLCGEADWRRSRGDLVRLRRRRWHRGLGQRRRHVQRDARARAPRLQREDIAKLWGGNLLRVWREVESVARRLQADAK